MFHKLDRRKIIEDGFFWLSGLASIGLMSVLGLLTWVLTVLPEPFHYWAPLTHTAALFVGGFWAVWAWQRQSHWRKDVSTSDEWVYERLRRGRLGDWMFDDLVGQGLTVDAALAKMQAAAERIEQETGKQPSMPTARKIQRLRRAEQKDNG